jgi:hypothetical protein
MLRTLGQTGRWFRLFIVVALVAMGAGLFTTPVSAAKSTPKPMAQLEVYVQAHRADDAVSGLSNARVMISDETGMPVMKALTNPDGYCLFELNPGTYIVDAIADGYYNAKARVELAAGGPTRVLVMSLYPINRPPAYRMLSVFVTDSPVKDIGIADASVQVFDAKGVIQAEGLTDVMGYFKARLLVGPYTVLVNAYGYHPMKMAVEVTMDPVTDVYMVLHPVNQQALNVFVANDTGRIGIPGADVTILDLNGTQRAKGFTDNMGFFKPLMVPGVYKLNVTAPKYQPAGVLVEVTGEEGQVVIVGLHPTVTYGLLQLYVTNGYKDVPIVGANVTVKDMSDAIQAQGPTDTQGFIKATLPSGTYKVSVTATGYEPTTVSVEVIEESVTYRVVDMYPTTHGSTQ